MKKLIKNSVISLLVAGGIGSTGITSASTFDDVMNDKKLTCIVEHEKPGFTKSELGIDVDTCRAVSAAVLGDANKIVLTSQNSLQHGKELLQKGTGHLLIGYTPLRSADNVAWAGNNFYDGVRVMVDEDRQIESVRELAEADICEVDTDTGDKTKTFFRQQKIDYYRMGKEAGVSGQSALDKYLESSCFAYTDKLSNMIKVLSEYGGHAILPEVISTEPRSVAVRAGDEHWRAIVMWTLNAMIIAEQQGITSETVKPSFLESSGTDLGLVPQAAYHVIRQVGNYGEVFEKHVGHKSEFKLKRGANALEEDGGLAAPFVIR